MLWARALLFGDEQHAAIRQRWNRDGYRREQLRAKERRGLYSGGNLIRQVALLRRDDPPADTREGAAVFQQRWQRRHRPRRHEIVAPAMLWLRANSSARPVRTVTFARPSAATASCWKRAFLPVASSEVTRHAGKAMASGMPGKPAPLPISSRRKGRARWCWRDSEEAGERVEEVARHDLGGIGDRGEVDARVRVEQQVAEAAELVELRVIQRDAERGGATTSGAKSSCASIAVRSFPPG